MLNNIFIIVALTVLIQILNKALLFLQFRLIAPSYDHYYHLNLIKGIEQRKHRFLNNTPTYIAERNFFYPQLYHWILSFFGSSWSNKYFVGINQFISFTTTLSVLFFSAYIRNNFYPAIPFLPFIVSVGIVYWITPFSYYIWNAKNCGISVRGFGLLLGFWYLFCIVLFVLHNNIGIYFALIILASIILLSSQFAFQFVLFSALFFSLFNFNIWLLFPPFFAVLLYLAILPTQALSFIKGQYYHKKIWRLYLSEMMLKKSRYSIWRDLVNDIWKKKI